MTDSSTPTKTQRFLSILNLVAPGLLMAIPVTAPIAGILTHAMATAEQIPGASGPEKLQAALTLTQDAVGTTNALAKRQVLDPQATNDAVASAIATAIKTVKLIQDAHPVATAA